VWKQGTSVERGKDEGSGKKIWRRGKEGVELSMCSEWGNSGFKVKTGERTEKGQLKSPGSDYLLT